MDHSSRKCVEIFHLLFLDQLGRKVDKRFYAVKGGCNLRFFFRSQRYSEDMDLDVRDIPVHTLEEKVNLILKSDPFIRILLAHGIRLDRVRSDKQTQTTQRWKLGLMISPFAERLPTKVEFSRRGMSEDTVFEPVDPLLIREYRLSPVSANHYSGEAALRQKIGALIDRREVQARDIFDLDLLLRSGVKVYPAWEKPGDKLKLAKERIFSLDYDIFKSQVLAYLPAEDQELYDSGMWDAMRIRVCEAIEVMQS